MTFANIEVAATRKLGPDVDPALNIEERGRWLVTVFVASYYKIQ